MREEGRLDISEEEKERYGCQLINCVNCAHFLLRGSMRLGVRRQYVKPLCVMICSKAGTSAARCSTFEALREVANG